MPELSKVISAHTTNSFDSYEEENVVVDLNDDNRIKNYLCEEYEQILNSN
jgi:hypothetical protein